MKTEDKYTDRELIDKVLNKETAIFELIIRRNNPHLYRIGRMYRFSHEDTQDLMQETYIEAFMHLYQFEDRSSFRTWISKIMLHQCYRKKQKWSSRYIQPLENNSKAFENLYNTETSIRVMNRELNSVIEKSLLNIPEDYRIAFTLREINGLSVQETSETLRISEGNVKVRVNRAKAFLRKEIEKYYIKEEIFEFNLIYCDEMVNRVMGKLIEI
ncbi:RNA polymerase subunit sigma-24 [Chryseobacterium contaminans]|uniref:RNA polymerase sigma-70 factor, ECF subfamily n=1 Tax=Chryseobacterium contaminans TaxID=1423959 RepID=A0A1M6YF26_9FLAO|nr:sigma-70 family RNA polymerase sigma factor [Chryseobacterium contaminans]OCA78594.1 RNA polymerase subunit sigma-24 [Chryseobacterium contaminans]SHL16670.1 RNA polymerase sigma-70 factor, ECF subfamily [Chryseobacterium contaminans]